MNTKITWKNSFTGVLYTNRTVFPNTFDVSITLDAKTEEFLPQNIAAQRINFLIEDIFDGSVFVCFAHPEIKSIVDVSGAANFVLTPEVPADQIIGMLLYNKIKAVINDVFEIVNIDISSNAGKNIVYHIDEYTAFSSEDDDTAFWWNTDDFSTSITDEPELVAWEEVDLGWDQECTCCDCDECDCDECDCEDDEPSSVAPVIEVLDGGKQ